MQNSERNNKEQKVYGLIGYPLVHSFSQTYFNQKFESEGINACYKNFELPDIGDLMEVFAENPTLAGLNVTIPYKQQIIPYLDGGLDELAKRIGAVNVVKITRGNEENDFQLKGYNSDCYAFMDSIRSMIKPGMKKALVLGSGGASKAVCVALEELGIQPQVVSRNSKEGAITYAELSLDVMKEHKIIVNTTPLGMYPHVDECPAIPYEMLDNTYLCYDLIYNPEQTLFMKKAERQGATTKNGLEMLLLQAFESWEIWNR